MALKDALIAFLAVEATLKIN